MARTASSTSAVLIDKVADWLMHTALEDADLEAVVRGCCNRLAATGLPLARVNLSFSFLHPLYRAMGFTWQRNSGLEIQGYRHVRDGEVDRFTQSPFYYMIENELDVFRHRLDQRYTENEFPIFEELREQGLTDYVGFVSEFQRNSGKGMIGSWATDREGGFEEEEIAQLLRIQKQLAVACKMAVQGSLASNMLTTYLGDDAGHRVLDGQIRRGDGETVRAALVMADMRNSTTLAEELGRQHYIDALNVFFDCVAAPFAESGGQILSFLGDGFLAVFPCGRTQSDSEIACSAALKAAHKAVECMAEANCERREREEPTIGFGIGLHIGNVMFGNVGLEDRLTFSVFGAAVNEASRLESLTKRYATPIVASEAFVDYCKGEWRPLGEERLRGVGHAIRIHAPLDHAQARTEPARARLREAALGHSDAEHVILLHRDARR